MGGVLAQISVIGPMNAVRLCRSSCVFYRMKEKAEQALGKGLHDEALEYRQKSAIAFVSMRASVDRICTRVAGQLKKGGEEGAGERLLEARKEMAEKLANLNESCRPGFGIEKLVEGLALALAASGLALGEKNFLKAAVVVAAVALMVLWKEFAAFVEQVARLVHDKLLE